MNHDGTKKLGGPYDDEEEAKKRLGEIEYFKHKDDPGRSSALGKVERRTCVGKVELRAAPEGSDSPGTIVGYAAVFGKLSLDLGYFREEIDKGAFADCLKTDDIRCLDNHLPERLLGRNRSATLRMEEDDVGLRFECDLPNTTTGRDTAVEVGRGDKSGCSFSFDADVIEWNFSASPPVRRIRHFSKIYDVGPVTYPAYDDTSVAMAVRSFEAAKASHVAPPPAPQSDPLSLARARQRLAEASL